MDDVLVLSTVLLGLFTLAVACMVALAIFLQRRRPRADHPVVVSAPVDARVVFIDSPPGEESTCCCCMDRPAGTLLECGHAQLCLDCAQRMRNCPLCRKPMGAVILAVA